MFTYLSEFNDMFTSSAYYHMMSDISEQKIVIREAIKFINIINDNSDERIKCM